MQGETQEDKVRIVSVDTVGLVNVELGALFPGAQPFHDFVLAFPWYISA